MRLLLHPLAKHPGRYLLEFQRISFTPEWNAFVAEVVAWMTARGIDHGQGNHWIARMTDDQAFETRMRWG